MFKKTRYRFIAISMTALSLVLVFIFGTINLFMYIAAEASIKDDINNVIKVSALMADEREFAFPFGGLRSSAMETSELRSTKYITAFLDTDGEVISIMSNMSDDFTNYEMRNLSSQIISTGETQGTYGNFRFTRANTGKQNILVILDVSAILQLLKVLHKASIVIITISMLIEFTFVLFMSKRAIRPMETAFENQKRFVSDASHELKTPLAVISASADVLEAESGESKWLTTIKDQSQRMTDLVYNLLDLSKLDETSDTMVFSDFNLSDIITNTALEFECTAFESGKTLTTEIKENVMCHANEQTVKQLMTILIDNAVKHSDEHGKIHIGLKTSGIKKIITVFNTGKGIRDDEREKIFQRFYRSDESRSRDTGGYGLGLAIAKSIAESNKGSISVDGVENQWIRFTVIL